MQSTLSSRLQTLWLEIVMGLETHVTITSTQSKLFCACPNRTGEKPNSDICPICTGQMGVLPQVNKWIIAQAAKLSQALHWEFSKTLLFDRKHYSYPDLPKGYQLTQYQKPISLSGYLQFLRKDWSEVSVTINHFHIEEDPAKLTHTKTKTLIDYNRSGKPLFEIVTTPSVHSIEDAISYMEQLQKLIRYLWISDADMEKGHFKSDISISLRKLGSTDLNPRTEIKNMNSFRFALQALEQEIDAQITIWEKTGAPQTTQQTKGWREDTNSLELMRKKEQLTDYKFMEEPDIPEISIEEIDKKRTGDNIILPFEIEKKLHNVGFKLDEIVSFSSHYAKVKTLLSIIKDKEDTLYDTAKILMNTPSSYWYDGTIDIEVIQDLLTQAHLNRDFDQTVFKTVIDKIAQDSSFDYHTYITTNTTIDQELQKKIDSTIEKNKELWLNSWAILWLISKEQIIPREFSRSAILSYIQNIIGEVKKEKNTKPKSEKNKLTIEKNYEYDYNNFLSHYRTYHFSEISEELNNQHIIVSGWIQSIRDHGDLVFIDLRSESEILQIQLDRSSSLDIDTIVQRANESVISVHGKVIKRQPDDSNDKLRLGFLEIAAEKIVLLSGAQHTPFEIQQSHHVNESKRMEYRYLDLRNPRIMDNLIKRHEVVKYMRNYFDDQWFLHVDTPILGKPSDEWSREFCVPSRLHPNSFYTLPQAPQQLKQILMWSGVDKYYQIARCFRDEDPKGDRQPEFTQVDLELAYITEEDITSLISNLVLGLITTIYPQKNILHTEIPHYDYDYVMEHYSIDKPDMRYGLKMYTVTDIVAQWWFKVFNDIIAAWWIVKCMVVEWGKNMFSKKYLDSSLREFVQQLWGGGLANFHVGGEQNFVEEKLGQEVINTIIKATGAVQGDTLLFAADTQEVVHSMLSSTRTKIATDYKLFDNNDISLLWVRNFPMFEKTDEGNWKFTHNPFSLPKIECLEDFMAGEHIESILAQQYDIVMNGSEIWGWSIRAHLPELLTQTYKIMWYSPEETTSSVGHIINAFQYGFPPHGGLALWLDRLLMILQGHSTIREVIPFPKTGDGKDLLMNAPSTMKEEQLKEVFIKTIAI